MRNHCLVYNRAILAGLYITLFSCAGSLYANQGRGYGIKKSEAKPTNRSFFIEVPEQFKALERAPVLFPHDKHTIELEAEGCGACHSNSNGVFVFTNTTAANAKNRDAFMNSAHDLCVKCHTERSKAGKEAGPLTCGECHVKADSTSTVKYLPKMPEYYSPMKDTPHKNCIACHKSPAKSVDDAKELDWKSFQVKETERTAIVIPKVSFDYYLHDKHNKALENKCGKCHYLSPELKQKLEAEGKTPDAQDWLREVEKGRSLTKRTEAHARCLNCHLTLAQQSKKTGAVMCKDCHSGNNRTAEEMKDIPRPECQGNVNRRFLIKRSNTTESRMAAVAFDHKAHLARSRSCQECHHATLESCDKCHTGKGDISGNFITLPEAFHSEKSTRSCIGCHEEQKKKPDCAGCHSMRKSGLQQSACSTCHSGSLEPLDNMAKKPDPVELGPIDMKNERVAAILSNEYEPSHFRHNDIARALTDISNKSSLATYFHKNEMTICMGCHHMEPMEKGKSMAECAACHTARLEPKDSTPALLGAYHQNCIGCHQQMDRSEKEMPQKCEGCHKEKKPATKH